MRSKNLLPVQVVMPSSLMGSSQSLHKAAFEEALHNSIETSLRSSAVAPSSVFSSLFLNFRPSSSSTSSDPADVKPNSDELDYEINRQNANQMDETTEIQNAQTSSKPPLSSFHMSPTKSAAATLESGPPALLSMVSRPPGLLGEQQKPIAGDGRQQGLGAHGQSPFISQQQQLEARVEQIKQLQRLQAWQQMQKEQTKPHPLLRFPSSSDQTASQQNIPLARTSSIDIRSPTSVIVPSSQPVNGVHSNGNVRPIRTSVNLRQAVGGKGFCKSGKDIRLVNIEHDCSVLVPFPNEYVLLALQTTLTAMDSSNTIVISINLKSLPPPNSSSQALSVQCVGCGEKSIHTFVQLSEHVGLETSVDPLSTRFNSSQLIGPHARFYLIRDPTHPQRLIRGPPVLWHKAAEGRMRSGIPVPRIPMLANMNTSMPMFRGNVPVLTPPAHAGITPTRMQEPVPPSPQLRSPARFTLRGPPRPHLSRTLSGPLQSKLPEAMKRQMSSISQDEIMEIIDDPPPKRYMLSQADTVTNVEIPQDFASVVDRKVVILFLHPLSSLPHFSGDVNSIIVTSQFAECFKELSHKARQKLDITEQSSILNRFMLLVTVQYLVSLGPDGNLSMESLCCAVAQAKQNIPQEFHSSLKDLKPSGIVILAKLAAAASNGLVDVVYSKVSIADGISTCLKEIQTSSFLYQLIVYISDGLKEEIHFHLLVTGKLRCRAVAERLLSDINRSSVISQGLVSLPFTQLRLSLPESTIGDITAYCVSKSSTSNFSSSMKDFNCLFCENLCQTIQQSNTSIAAALLTKVQHIFDHHDDIDLSRFTSLRFVFLQPPSPALLSQTINNISNSDVLSQLYKTSLPVATLSSQVVVTMETSSKQRLVSMCKQWEDSSTLLVLIQIDAHSSRNSLEACSFLNDHFMMKSKNILTIQCSSSPYPLLTDRSRISSSNLVHCTAADTNCEQSNNTSLYFGTSTSCYTSLSTTFDPKYELQKDQFLKSNHTLHTSLVACEVLTQQYNISLMMSSLDGKSKLKVKKNLMNFSSPLINQVIQELLDSSQTHLGDIVMVRISSSILATRFYDTIKQTRDKLNLENAFEVVLYNDTERHMSLSSFFLEILQAQHSTSSGWFPSSLSELVGIPCLVVYEGEDLISQVMPKTLKYVDMRLSFEGILHRSKIEQELSLVVPVCNAINKSNMSKWKIQENKLSEDDDDKLQVVESDDNQSDESSFTWPSVDYRANSKGLRTKSRNEEKQLPFVQTSFDFISLAMKEADLPSGKRDASNTSQIHSHQKPTSILPQRIYNLINDVQVDKSLANLPPHPLCKWSESLHPINKSNSPDQLASYYRKWTTPAEGNPDYYNCSADLLHTIDDKRILLITPPNCQPVEICCEFLLQLHSTLIKMLEISVYDDPENSNDSGTSFRTLVSNSLCRGISQISNTCEDTDNLSQYMKTDDHDAKVERKVITRQSVNKHAFNIKHRSKDASAKKDAAEMTSPTCEYVLKSITSDSDYKGELYFRFVIPGKSLRHFKFSKNEDGNSELKSLQLKLKTDKGIKTPVVSMGLHGADEGLYNLSQTLNGSELVHMVIVKDCDAESYKKMLPSHILVVLPIEFDHLGKGAMKYAGQIVFEHFFECRSKEEPDMVWPFVLFMNDDSVAWSVWKNNHPSISDRDGTAEWDEVSLDNMMQMVEASLTYDLTAVGFRPWCSSMKVDHAYCHDFLGQENYLRPSYVESCFFINVSLTASVKYKYTRFESEDIDWSLRVAAAGLNVYRFENIAVTTKVMTPLQQDSDLLNKPSSLVSTADSDYEPLCYHPALLLEKYFSSNASSIFPFSKGEPSHPVLCVDCYLSLGTEICVEFTSSKSNALPWTFDSSKQYGGLILHCINSNDNPKFLQHFKFIEGAIVCVVGNDRSSLRQTVVNLNLETTWHFRLTDEFQTANSTTLGGARVRPLYFLTGVKKGS